jgi:hypothetical protein
VRTPDPAPTGADEAALELALLQRLVDEILLPAPGLPGWQSGASTEYARAVHGLSARLAAASSALAAARAAS